MKAGWFQQAKSVFARPEPVPQTYAVPCDCGTTVQGERADKSQKTGCPTCGQTVFVLPACTFPIPTSVRNRWLGEEDIAEPVTKSRSGRKRKKADRAPTIVQTRPRSVPWSERRQQFAAAAWAQITPIRLIGVAVALSMVMISYVIYRQARWSHAQSTVQSAIDAGTQAIAERDFAQAAASLTQASAALDILGRDDDASHAIRRLALEATVCDGLSVDSLPILLSELFDQHGDDEIAARFDRRFAGQWILFDAPLYLAAEENRKPARAVSFDLPLLIDDELVELQLEGNPWPALLSGSTGALPKRVIFAAQLDRLEPPTKTREAVRVWLRGETAVLWSEAETLEALGFLPTDADQITVVKSILSAQRDLLKVRE